MRVSLSWACGRTLEGKVVSAFELRPSYRRFLADECQL